MSLAAIPLLAGIVVLAVRYPYALAALALFLPMESPGVGAVVDGSYRLLVPLLYGGYFLAVFRALHVLWTKRNISAASRRIFRIALFVTGTSFWIAFSMFACDSGKMEMIYSSLGAVPGALFALAYYNNRAARILLGIVLALHLLIGCGAIAFPYGPFALFRASTSLGTNLPDVWRMETTSYKDNAQFESAAHLAFYAAAGLILGMTLVLYHRKPLQRVAGVCLALLGGAASFFTLERGIWIGIFIGLLVLVAPLRRQRVGKLAHAVIISVVVLGVAAVCTSVDNFVLVALREHFLAVREDSYRIPVAIRSMDILVTKPLFGVGGDLPSLVETVGGAPHQSFYFFAVTYGIPAGLFVGLLTWWSVAPGFCRRRHQLNSDLRRHDHLLAKTLGIALLATALTNGMCGGMAGWILLGFACLPWAFSSTGAAAPFAVPHYAVRRERQ